MLEQMFKCRSHTNANCVTVDILNGFNWRKNVVQLVNNTQWYRVIFVYIEMTPWSSEWMVQVAIHLTESLSLDHQYTNYHKFTRFWKYKKMVAFLFFSSHWFVCVYSVLFLLDKSLVVSCFSFNATFFVTLTLSSYFSMILPLMLIFAVLQIFYSLDSILFSFVSFESCARLFYFFFVKWWMIICSRIYRNKITVRFKIHATWIQVGQKIYIFLYR